MSGGVKPFRAQAGSGLTDGWRAQLPALALAGEADGGCGLPLQAVITRREAADAAAAASRYLISRRYAGHDVPYRPNLVRWGTGWVRWC